MQTIVLIINQDFLLGNLYWIVALASTLVLVAFFLIDHLIEKKKKAPKKEAVNVSLYLEALGGKDNLIEKNLVGSRIVVRLHDYTLVNRDKLREAGVSGFILMSDRLTLVIKDNAENVYKKIFPSEA